jgi:hypothetical protein
MPREGFKPTIPAFERAKTVHALDRAVTVIDVQMCRGRIILKLTKTKLRGRSPQAKYTYRATAACR